MDAFWAAPPVIRSLTAAVVLTSVAVYGGILSGYRIIFFPEALYATFPPQIWRLVTAFWLTGPQLSIVMDPYFLYTYGSQLEKDSPRFPRAADFFVYVIFIQLLILIASNVLGGAVFLQPLILAFVYTFAQENQRRRVSLWFFQFEARFLPFALLGMTLVMAGPSATWQQASGLLAAHAYEFLTKIWPTYGGGSNLLQTPQWVVRAFGEDRPSARVKGYGTAFPGRPGQTANSSASTAGSNSGPGNGGAAGWSSAFSGWSHRGPGRRLGGD